MITVAQARLQFGSEITAVKKAAVPLITARNKQRCKNAKGLHSLCNTVPRSVVENGLAWAFSAARLDIGVEVDVVDGCPAGVVPALYFELYNRVSRESEEEERYTGNVVSGRL